MTLSMSLSSLSPPLANDYPWRQCWRCCSMLHSTSLPLLCSKTVRSPRRFGTKALVQSAETQSADGNDAPEEEIQVLSAIRSNYNDIVILDTPKSRILLLDSSSMLCLFVSCLSSFHISTFSLLIAC